MPTDMPSLDLLRSLTDEHVLRLLMEDGRMTRAEMAVRSGISKTTISESVRRLEALELVVDTGERTSGRGRSGSYYALSETCGSALVTTIRPKGVTAEVVDAAGATAALMEVPLEEEAGEEAAAAALLLAASEVRDAAGSVLRLAVVSVADPVDRKTGRLVQLPDAPFLVGDLDAVAILAPVVESQILVDNDINWAAQAEHETGIAAEVDDFVYLHLGEGLGFAVVADGEVRRGARGLAGEIAHLVTRGVDGVATPFTEVFAQLGLRQRGSTAIDVEGVVRQVTEERPGDADSRNILAGAVAGVIAAAIALTDPELVVMGGDWGQVPAFRDEVRRQLDETSPRKIRVEGPKVINEPDHAGARHTAITALRTAIVESVRAAGPVPESI